jgi:hypothetical protein
MRNGKGPEEMRNGKGPEEMRNGKGPEEMRNGEGPEEMRNGDKRNSEGYDGRNRPPEMGGIMKYPREFYSHRKEYFHF